VAGLKAGAKHGFHIHQVSEIYLCLLCLFIYSLILTAQPIILQYGDLSLNDGTSAGAHWNPNGRNHELPGTNPRHVGDLVRPPLLLFHLYAWTNQLHPWKSIGLQGNIQSFDANTGLGWYNFTDANIPNVYSLLGRSVRFVFFVFCFCSSALTRGHRRWLSTPMSITALAPAAIKLVLVSCVVHVSCVVSCGVSCGVVSCRVVSQ
jgi:hypothetical protein